MVLGERKEGIRERRGEGVMGSGIKKEESSEGKGRMFWGGDGGEGVKIGRGDNEGKRK